MLTKVLVSKTSSGIEVSIQLPEMEARVYVFQNMTDMVRKAEQWYDLAHTMAEPEQAVNYLEQALALSDAMEKLYAN